MNSAAAPSATSAPTIWLRFITYRVSRFVEDATTASLSGTYPIRCPLCCALSGVLHALVATIRKGLEFNADSAGSDLWREVYSVQHMSCQPKHASGTPPCAFTAQGERAPASDEGEAAAAAHRQCLMEDTAETVGWHRATAYRTPISSAPN